MSWYMLTTTSRIRIQEIFTRLAEGKVVTLQERIYLNKFASRDPSVAAWLRKAANYQQNKHNTNSIDALLDGLDLSSSEPYSTYNSDTDDLGEWFSGAP